VHGSGIDPEQTSGRAGLTLGLREIEATLIVRRQFKNKTLRPSTRKQSMSLDIASGEMLNSGQPYKRGMIFSQCFFL
jgi:hypothetical protein